MIKTIAEVQKQRRIAVIGGGPFILRTEIRIGEIWSSAQTGLFPGFALF